MLLREVEREPGKTVPLLRRTQEADRSTVILNWLIKLIPRMGPSTWPWIKSKLKL